MLTYRSMLCILSSFHLRTYTCITTFGAMLMISQASTYFFKKRGQAIGMVAAGSALGGVIFPIMVTHLIPQVGFGWAMRICAFLILGMLIFANLTVTSRIPPTKRKFSFAQYYKPLAEVPFLLNALGIFFFYWGMFIPFTFIVEEAISHGMGQQLAYYLVSILNGARYVASTYN